MASLYAILLTCAVCISLAGCQENPLTLTFNIKEEESQGTFIGSVSTANLQVPSEDVSSLQYNFLQNTQTYFSINSETGNLFTMTRIDRESICSDFTTSSDCEILVKVSATSGSFYKTIDVKVIIGDINDNSPLFPSLSTTLDISEGVTVGSEFSIPSAKDDDSGNYSVQRYEMTPKTNAFELKFEKKLAGDFEVLIIVREPLDRETQNNYRFTVTAYDGGDPYKSGSIVVIINVLDINDNQPYFNQSEYRKTVEEGTPRGTTVLTLHASDEDIGENGRVSYRILDRFPVTDFALNSSSGNIFVNTDNLQYIADKKYEFIVEAYDNGEQSKSHQAWVKISVNDTGNNRPKITISLLSAGNINFVNVSENVKRGFFVAHVTVKDSDTGLNGEVTCRVTDNYFLIEKLEEEDAFKVIVNNPLNREIQDMHTVNVTCTDKGTPGLSSSEAFLVRVTDYNDNKPVFVKSNYIEQIPENLQNEQVLVQVSANDKDIGVNKEIHYEIRAQDDRIAVNRVTGVISVKPFFDRESTPVVSFVVLAIDGGLTPLTGTATVTLTIEDVNDNAPKFTQENYDMEITENLNSGTFVDQLSATDEDVGLNGMFSFGLAPAYIDQRLPFTIVADGSIQTNRALNREERSSYNFQAVVTDQGNPELSSFVGVTIIVGDVNDNKPNITFPSDKNRTVSILYPNAELDVVTQIEAFDLDNGENGTLRYRIVSGNDLGLFHINENNGKIIIADHHVKIEEDLIISLSVEVRDNGIQSLKSTADLIIKVVYSNATFAESTEEQNFVVIVVVVVVITVLLSGVIIAIIFFLRNFDRKKRLAESKSQTSTVVNNDYVNKPSMYILNNTGESSTDYIMVNSDAARKKKEVSFSLDERDSINNYQHMDLHVNLTPEPISYAPEKPPRQESPDSTKDLYDKVTTRLETLKLQQMLMETRSKAHHPAPPHVNPDDSRSESSGETSSGDSGRGASEEEVPSASPSHDDQKMFEYAVPVKKPYTSLSAMHSSPAKNHNYSAVPPPIPHRTYKPYSSFNTNNQYNNAPSQQYKNNSSDQNSSHHHSDMLEIDPSMLSWQHAQPHPHYPMKSRPMSAQSDYSYGIPHNMVPSYIRNRSQDDDDCSTTTSGSYTLHSVEDLL